MPPRAVNAIVARGEIRTQNERPIKKKVPRSFQVNFMYAADRDMIANDHFGGTSKPGLCNICIILAAPKEFVSPC